MNGSFLIIITVNSVFIKRIAGHRNALTFHSSQYTCAGWRIPGNFSRQDFRAR